MNKMKVYKLLKSLKKHKIIIKNLNNLKHLQKINKQKRKRVFNNINRNCIKLEPFNFHQILKIKIKIEKTNLINKLLMNDNNKFDSDKNRKLNKKMSDSKESNPLRIVRK